MSNRTTGGPVEAPFHLPISLSLSLSLSLPLPLSPTLSLSPSLSLSLADVFAVIDLYGQCVQVSITTSSGPLDNSLCTSNITEKSFPIHSPGTCCVCVRACVCLFLPTYMFFLGVHICSGGA